MSEDKKKQIPIEESADEAEEVKAEDAEEKAEGEAAEETAKEEAEKKEAEEAKKAEEAESERYMRLMAEFQNFKRRAAKEKSDIHAYANEKIVGDLLPVLDNFERALSTETEDEGYAKGMQLIFEQLKTALGNAGLAYLQAVLVTALQDAGTDDIDCSDVRFKRAVVDFEKALKSVDGIRHIEDTFGEFGSYNNFDDIFDEEPLIFDSIAYGYDVIDITYQHLLRAYKQTIEKILNDEISDINRRVQNHIKRNPCKPESGEMDDFKIALVGGFGSFYLVKKQIAEIYNIVADNKNDMRFKNIRTDKSEQAISLGAALLASGRVNLQKTARYSIGLCTKGTDKKKHLYYGIKYHQLLETGKPYFICYNDNPKRRVIYTNLKNNLNEFAVGFSYEFNKFTNLK